MTDEKDEKDEDFDPTIPPPLEKATDADLKEAVGVAAVATKEEPPPKIEEPEEEEDLADKPRRRTPLIIAAALIAGGAIATVVLLGWSNSGRYEFHCGANKITAERGRSFPPWGTSRMGGAAWKPIEIPPNTECKSSEPGSEKALEQLYLDALVAQAELALKVKSPTDIDRAQAQLEQALLLSRDPDRADQRAYIDRLMGDVEYWRGATRVKAAIETLEEAGKRYDTAVEKRPRFAGDSAAWASWVRQLAAGLRGGPGSGTSEPAPAPSPSEPVRPPAPTGVALPVEETLDGGVAPITPVDAGVPRGGVLL